MKISIVTAVRNRADCIAKAVHSAQSQTWHDVQHVVVDGASTDGTLEILRSLLSPHSPLLSEPDQGIYDALNKGIALSDGEVVGVLHSDDTFANSRILEIVASEFSRDPDLDVVFGDVAFFDAGDPTRCVRLYDSSRFQPSRLAWGWMPAHTTMFFRRRVFERHGLYRTDYRIAGDFEFLARVFADKALVWRYLPQVMVHMRTGGASAVTWRSVLTLNREILRACRANGIPTNLFKLLTRYPFKLLEVWLVGSRRSHVT